MNDWKKFLFLGSPVISDLSNLVSNGLFINDLSIHDHSRDLCITSAESKVEDCLLKVWMNKAEDEVRTMKMREENLRKENDRKFKAW